MRREQHRVIFAERAYERAHLYYLLRVKTDRRLVEDYERRIADESLRYTDSLAVALRQILDEPFPHVRYLCDGADLLEMLFAVVAAAFELICEIQVFVDGHVEVERRLLGQIPYQLFSRRRLVEDVVSLDEHASRRARKKTRYDVYRRRFARAVRSEETHDLAALYLEADPVDRVLLSVPFDEIFNLDHVLSFGFVHF